MTVPSSKPFVIWTMRRTGGTTFANLLMDMSSWPRVDHEPFNYDRSFGHVSKTWYENRDADRTRADLDAALAPRPLIKHCHEIHGGRLNNLLLETTLRHGYAHLELYRRNEVDRLLSLQLAQVTGVWGKMGAREGYRDILEGNADEIVFDIDAALQHLEKCVESTQRIRRRLRKEGVPLHTVWFEDLYSDLDHGRRIVGAALDYLGFPAGTAESKAAAIDDALANKGQNSARVLQHVANIDEARERLGARLSELTAPDN